MQIVLGFFILMGLALLIGLIAAAADSSRR